MATLVKRFYCHRYIIFNKRCFSNDGGQSDPFDRLRKILKQVKNAGDELPNKKSIPGLTPIVDASRILKQQQQQKEQKQTQTQTQSQPKLYNIQNPLPIPTQLDSTYKPTQIPQIQATKKEEAKEKEKEKAIVDSGDIELQQRIETELESQFEPLEIEGKIRPFSAMENQRRPSQRLKIKTDNKVKYKEIATDVKNEMNNYNKSEVDDIENMKNNIEINDEISKWICDKIIQCNAKQLPTPNDIVIEFPQISIQTAKDIRDDLIDEFINNNENYIYKLDKNDKNRFDDRDHNTMHDINNNNSLSYSTFNPKETNPLRDPFDFYTHSKSEFDGIQEFDPAFHRNGVNLNGLNPESFYGYNNMIYDDYFNCAEPNIKVIESEYGKFKSLLTTMDITTCDINMLMDLRRKIYKINNDLKTITFGITSENRKEFIGNMDISNSEGDTMQYFEYLFHLIDDIIHLKKPLIIASSGVLSDVQIPIYLSSAVRLGDSSMRFVFNNLLYGQIPFGGFYYHNLININQNNVNPHKLFWHLLSNEPISCNNAHEIGMVDWIMPSPNNVLFFNHFANEMDRNFHLSFKKQDEFRHRAKIKSIIELFDRGMEYYNYNKTNQYEILLLDYIFKGINIHSDISGYGGIDKIIEKIEQISEGDFDFDIIGCNDEIEIKKIIHKANVAINNIYNSSPLALYLSYILYYGSMKEYQTNQGNINNGTDFFRNLLKYEYNALSWLAYFGDFNEGIKYKNQNNYKPKWKWASMDLLLTSKDIKYLISCHENENNVLKDSIIFNELPSSNINKLKFNDNINETEDYLLFPQMSSLPNSVFNESVTSKMDIKNKKNSNHYYLSDYTMLRGTVPPNIQFKINKLYNNYRINKIYQSQLQS